VVRFGSQLEVVIDDRAAECFDLTVRRDTKALPSYPLVVGKAAKE
jgi:hypothetical protein